MAQSLLDAPTFTRYGAHPPEQDIPPVSRCLSRSSEKPFVERHPRNTKACQRLHCPLFARGEHGSSCILKAQSRAFSITTSVDVRDDDFRSLDLNLGAISEQDRRDAVLEVGLLRLVARLKALVGLGTYLLTFSLGYLYTWTY